jgi:hypothetical protein
MQRKASLFTVVAAGAALVACAPNTSPNGTKSKELGSDAGSSSDTDAGSGSAPLYSCGLYYLGGSGSISPQLLVGSTGAVVRAGFPTFNTTLGGSDAPYVASVSAVGYSREGTAVSAVDGYFDLGVQEPANPQFFLSTKAQVSLTTIAENPGDPLVLAGNLATNVPPFTYQGQTWSEVILQCLIE